MDYSLSNFDIMDLLKGQTKVITYDQLAKYKTIDELLSPYGSVVILYINSPTGDYGHWCAVIKHADRIEHFDSYSMVPDGEFKMIDKKTRKLNYKGLPYLSKLLYKSKYEIEYNHEQLQAFGDDISTCGRWVVLRIILKDIPLNEFIKLIKDTEMDPDVLVTILTKK
jgi:hypothetical protein